MAAALIVDRDQSTCNQLVACATAHGWISQTADSGPDALEALARREFDVVFADPRVTDTRPGAPFLDEIVRRHPGTAIVVLESRGSSKPAPHQIGGCRRLVKPLEPDQVERCFAQLDRDSPGEPVEPALLLEWTEPAMRRAIATAREVATADLPVLLVGEPGTGKRKLAEAIHAWSRRAGPLVTMRCPTLVDHLLENGLFGDPGTSARSAQVETSRRLRAARGGTLFLDELDALPGDLPWRLLRVLAREWLAHAEREGAGPIGNQPRMIVASCRAPDPDPRSRSQVVTIVLPPLRERRADLPTLIDFVMAKLRGRHRRLSLRLSLEARRKLLEHSWPGNVRELVDALEHAVVLALDRTIRMADLPERIWANAGTTRSAQEGSAESSSEREAIARTVATSPSLKRKRYGLA